MISIHTTHIRFISVVRCLFVEISQFFYIGDLDRKVMNGKSWQFSYSPDVLNGYKIWLMITICFRLNELSKLFGIVLICSIFRFCNCSLLNDFKISRGRRESACWGKKFNNSGDKALTSPDFKPAMIKREQWERYS